MKHTHEYKSRHIVTHIFVRMAMWSYFSFYDFQFSKLSITMANSIEMCSMLATIRQAIFVKQKEKNENEIIIK